MATLRPKNKLSYWARRVIEDEKAAEKLAEDASERIKQLYLTQYKKTALQMERLYAQVEGGKTPNRTTLWDYSRWREMEKSLSSFTKGGSVIERERITDCLDKVFEQVIGAPVTDFKGTGFVAKIDPKTVINTAWSGENYSNRIWKNRTALADRVRISMEDMVAGNKRLDEVRREIMHEFDVAYYQADRLVRTESSYVFNRTTIERYKRLGVERVEWITQETGYCKTCHERDGMIYPIASVPTIPAHPNCNCTYAAYTDADEWLDLGGDKVPLNAGNVPEDIQQMFADAKLDGTTLKITVSGDIIELNPEQVAQTAKHSGGRHNGKYINAQNWTDSSLKKAAKSYPKTILEHVLKIEEPAKAAERWDSMNEREREGTIQKWIKDILRNAEEFAVILEVLKERDML